MEPQLKIIRKVKGFEIFYEIAQRESQVLITSYWLKLGSKQKLKVGQIEEALRILYRNADNLSLCLLEEDGDTWFCRMEKEVIDFEVIINKSPSDVLNEEIHKSFNSKIGPLWRAKYIVESDEDLRDSNIKSIEHQNEPDELKLHNEFESNIIFSFNHVMSDGYTAFNICNSFLKALNDVVGGTVQTSYNFGKLNDGKETEEIVRKRLEFLTENPELYSKIKGDIADVIKDETILGEIFPVPENIFNKTKHIYRDLDKEATSKLVKTFKEHGVTFNSGFTALTNWALIEVLMDNGYSSEYLDISAFHTLNLRRYWKPQSEIQQGSHVGGLTLKTRTNRNVGNHFWQYAQDLHNVLKEFISGERIKDEAIPMFTTNPEEKLDFKELTKNEPTPKFYYSTTNMGEVGSLLQGRGKHVSLNWLTRCTSAHSGHTCCTHITQTYEGKFLYGLGYYAKFARDDFAEMYVDKIFNKISLLTN